MSSPSIILSPMASRRSKSRQAPPVTVPGEISISVASQEPNPTIDAGPIIADPASVQRVFTVDGPHAGTARVLAYRRVSTMEQMRSGTSLDAQDEEIRRYCQYARLPEPIDFEEAESGGAESQEKREKIAALLKAIRPGDLVIVAKLDRFSRDIVFTVSAVRDIIARGARFLSLAERFDACTPEGETQMAMWASIAQMERARIRDRTEGNRKRLRALGKYVEGLPPFGYVRAKGKDIHDKPRTLETDPPKAAIAREIFELCLAGKGIITIALHCQKHYPGASTFGTKQIQNMLKNRVYAGQVAKTPVRPSKTKQSTQKPAEWIDAHEAIVSLQNWYAVQLALEGRRSYGRKSSDRTSQWLIRGLARCAGCGSVVSLKPFKGGSHAGYYVCRKRYRACPVGGKIEPCKYLAPERQDTIDAQMEKIAIQRFKTLGSELQRTPPKAPHAPNFEGKRAQLIKGRSNLVSMASSGRWKMEIIEKEAARIEHELAVLDAEEQAHKAESSADTVDNRKGALAWVRSVADQWQTMAIPAKRAALAVIVDRITLGKEGLKVEWSDAPTMAVRYAQNRLPDPAAMGDEDPRRPARVLPQAEEGA